MGITGRRIRYMIQKSNVHGFQRDPSTQNQNPELSQNRTDGSERNNVETRTVRNRDKEYVDE